METWQRETDRDVRDMQQRIARADRLLAGVPPVATLAPNTFEMVKTSAFNQWDYTGLSLRFGSVTGRVLIRVSAACYANNLRTVLSYAIRADSGNTVWYDDQRGVINDRRSPHSEFDRIKNGMFVQAHAVAPGVDHTLELWLNTVSNVTLFGDEEGRVSGITATVRELP